MSERYESGFHSSSSSFEHSFMKICIWLIIDVCLKLENFGASKQRING